MENAVRGDDGFCMNADRIAFDIGHLSAGFFHDDSHGSDIIKIGFGFDHGVHLTLSHQLIASEVAEAAGAVDVGGHFNKVIYQLFFGEMFGSAKA